jgi:hypothetical protein
MDSANTTTLPDPDKRQSAETKMLDSKEDPQKEPAQMSMNQSTEESYRSRSRMSRGVQGLVGHGGQVLLKLAKFIGPGFMVYVVSTFFAWSL